MLYLNGFLVILHGFIQKIEKEDTLPNLFVKLLVVIPTPVEYSLQETYTLFLCFNRKNVATLPLDCKVSWILNKLTLRKQEKKR
jgi:hypothetical protein